MNNNLIDRIDIRVADRITIAKRFNTDPITTHRILQNTNFNFIKHFLASDDEVKANIIWDECHPFRYPAHDSRDYHSMDLDFIEKHLHLFGGKNFWTSAGWAFDEKNGTYWKYDNGYNDVALNFNN